MAALSYIASAILMAAGAALLLIEAHASQAARGALAIGAMVAIAACFDLLGRAARAMRIARAHRLALVSRHRESGEVSA